MINSSSFKERKMARIARGQVQNTFQIVATSPAGEEFLLPTIYKAAKAAEDAIWRERVYFDLERVIPRLMSSLNFKFRVCKGL